VAIIGMYRWYRLPPPLAETGAPLYQVFLIGLSLTLVGVLLLRLSRARRLRAVQARSRAWLL